MKKKYTARGFRTYVEFTDLYGTKIVVQESSLATRRAVWIQHDNPEDGKMIVGSDKPFIMTPHLSIAQAKKIIKGLQAFVDEG